MAAATKEEELALGSRVRAPQAALPLASGMADPSRCLVFAVVGLDPSVVFAHTAH